MSIGSTQSHKSEPRKKFHRPHSYHPSTLPSRESAYERRSRHCNGDVVETWPVLEEAEPSSLPNEQRQTIGQLDEYDSLSDTDDEINNRIPFCLNKPAGQGHLGNGELESITPDSATIDYTVKSAATVPAIRQISAARAAQVPTSERVSSEEAVPVLTASSSDPTLPTVPTGLLIDFDTPETPATEEQLSLGELLHASPLSKDLAFDGKTAADNLGETITADNVRETDLTEYDSDDVAGDVISPARKISALPNVAETFSVDDDTAAADEAGTENQDDGEELSGYVEVEPEFLTDELGTSGSSSDEDDIFVGEGESPQLIEINEADSPLGSSIVKDSSNVTESSLLVESLITEGAPVPITESEPDGSLLVADIELQNGGESPTGSVSDVPESPNIVETVLNELDSAIESANANLISLQQDTILRDNIDQEAIPTQSSPTEHTLVNGEPSGILSKQTGICDSSVEPVSNGDLNSTNQSISVEDTSNDRTIQEQASISNVLSFLDNVTSQAESLLSQPVETNLLESDETKPSVDINSNSQEQPVSRKNPSVLKNGNMTVIETKTSASNNLSNGQSSIGLDYTGQLLKRIKSSLSEADAFEAGTGITKERMRNRSYYRAIFGVDPGDSAEKEKVSQRKSWCGSPTQSPSASSGTTGHSPLTSRSSAPVFSFHSGQPSHVLKSSSVSESTGDVPTVREEIDSLIQHSENSSDMVVSSDSISAPDTAGASVVNGSSTTVGTRVIETDLTNTVKVEIHRKMSEPGNVESVPTALLHSDSENKNLGMTEVVSNSTGPSSRHKISNRTDVIPDSEGLKIDRSGRLKYSKSDPTTKNSKVERPNDIRIGRAASNVTEASSSRIPSTDELKPKPPVNKFAPISRTDLSCPRQNTVTSSPFASPRDSTALTSPMGNTNKGVLSSSLQSEITQSKRLLEESRKIDREHFTEPQHVNPIATPVLSSANESVPRLSSVELRHDSRERQVRRTEQARSAEVSTSRDRPISRTDPQNLSNWVNGHVPAKAGAISADRPPSQSREHDLTSSESQREGNVTGNIENTTNAFTQPERSASVIERSVTSQERQKKETPSNQALVSAVSQNQASSGKPVVQRPRQRKEPPKVLPKPGNKNSLPRSINASQIDQRSKGQISNSSGNISRNSPDASRRQQMQNARSKDVPHIDQQSQGQVSNSSGDTSRNSPDTSRRQQMLNLRANQDGRRDRSQRDDIYVSHDTNQPSQPQNSAFNKPVKNKLTNILDSLSAQSQQSALQQVRQTSREDISSTTSQNDVTSRINAINRTVGSRPTSDVNRNRPDDSRSRVSAHQSTERNDNRRSRPTETASDARNRTNVTQNPPVSQNRRGPQISNERNQAHTRSSAPITSPPPRQLTSRSRGSKERTGDSGQSRPPEIIRSSSQEGERQDSRRPPRADDDDNYPLPSSKSHLFFFVYCKSCKNCTHLTIK